MSDDWSPKQVVDALNDFDFVEVVESELGTPIKVQVDWVKREIIIRGPKHGRAMDLDEFMEASERDQKRNELQ